MIPLDVQAAYQGRTKVVESLKTASHSAAKLAATSRRAQLLQGFDQKRRELNPQRIEKITPELSKALAQRVASRVLSTDDKLRDDPEITRLLLEVLHPFKASAALRIGPPPQAHHRDTKGGVLDGLSEDEATELAGLNQGMDLYSAGLMSKRQLSALLPHVQAEALALGLVFDADTPGASDALLESLKSYRKACQGLSQRDQGEVIETPAAPALRDVPAAKPIKLRDVLPRWKASKSRKLATEKAAEKALSLYEEATGDPPISTLNRAQGVDMRAFLLNGGVTAKTARDRFDYIKGFLNFAHLELEVLPRNPWTGLVIEYRTTKPRRPSTGEQLAAFFARPLHTSYEVPTRWDSGADAAYWIPLLGVFTGCRISELCQLTVSDMQVSDGIPVLQVTNEGEGQAVKSSAGKRTVPIHSELVRLGLLEYVEAIRKAGAPRLFPALPLHRTKPGTYFSGWFGEGRELPDGTKLPDFHSLRHTVRSKLASAGTQEPTIDTIIGHDVKGSTGARVYTHRELVDLRRAIESIAYPGLHLPRVYVAPIASRPNQRTVR